MPETSTLTTSAVIAIIVSSIAFLLLTGLFLLFCHCRRVAAKKKKTNTSSPAKEYDLDSGRPSIVAQTNQAPPPYYPTGSLDSSKSLDSHAMELTLTAVQDNEEQLQQQQHQKSAATLAGMTVYGSQNGYGYHVTSTLGAGAGGGGGVSSGGSDADSYQVTPLAHSAIAGRSECKYPIT